VAQRERFQLAGLRIRRNLGAESYRHAPAGGRL
jgi:hypothetical protein